MKKHSLYLISLGLLGSVAVAWATIRGMQTELVVPRLLISSKGIECLTCARSGVAVADGIVFTSSEPSPPGVCMDTALGFNVVASNYFAGPGHLTVGLLGSVKVPSANQPGSLFGKGVVLGHTSGYPDGRGCANGPRVQIESYWPRTLSIPSELTLHYSSKLSEKGNELFPSSCSLTKLTDKVDYQVVVNVDCVAGIIRYALRNPLKASCEEFAVLDDSMRGVNSGKVNFEANRRVSDWWLGQVFGATNEPWSLEISNLSIAKRPRIDFPRLFRSAEGLAAGGSLCSI